jgi:mannose-6-phosphate isomerase-like protein (cupin superfamily)
MAVILEGGCRVSEMREGTPLVHGTLTVWPQIGRSVGAQAISLRVLEFAPGISPGMRNERSEEVLYVLENAAAIEVNSANEPARKTTVFIDGCAFAVTTETAIYLGPGQTLTVDHPGPKPLVLISSQCPEPVGDPAIGPRVTSSSSRETRQGASPLVHLANREAIPTADRWYRVLIDHEVGSAKVTQFVGTVPPGRAPDHFHDYEEVLFILRGTGRMWAGETHTQIAFGSCVYLPKGQVHCVENTGTEELQLLGVFYPAGSPAARYDV